MQIAVALSLSAGGMLQAQTPPEPFAPYNLEEPVINGEPYEGSQFTCTPGRWAGIPSATITYQWKRDGSNIGGETASTYTAAVADVEHSLSCEVTATNSEGSASLTTDSIGPINVLPEMPINNVLPGINGAALTGSLLTVIPGSWTAIPAATFTYRWEADGTPIDGATNTTYQLTNNEVGTIITVVEIATNVAGSVEAESAPTAEVVDPNPPYAPFLVQPPVITGNLIIGQTLTCSQGQWDANPDLTGVTYQWMADGFELLGATESTYVIADTNQAKRITCLVVAFNSEGGASFTANTAANVGRGFAVNKYYIRRVTYGTGDGSSWDNALPITSLNWMISVAGAYGEVLIRADEGTYTASLITLTNGGPVGQPVIVRGCDVNENAMYAVILGSRTDPWVAGGTTGPEVIRMIAGVHDVTFRNLEFTRCGNGCFRIGDNVDGIVIEQCIANNVQRFIENTVSGTALTANLTNAIIRNCAACGFGRAFMRLQYDCSNILVEDCYGDALQQDGENFGCGCVLSGTAHDVTYQRCIMRNPYDSQGGNQANYWNGDCYSQENGNYNVQYIDCLAKGATDGGFDCKGQCSFLRCIADENKKNFRIWGTATLVDCVARDCYLRGGNSEASQISFHSASATAILDNFVALDTRAATTVFRIDEATANVTFNSGSLQYDAGATLVYNPNGAPFDIGALVTPPIIEIQCIISGTEKAGETLSVTPGTWDDEGVLISYQWCRDGLYIDDATDTTMTLGTAEVGKVITCRVFATNANRHTGENISTATGVIAALGPSNVTQPTISGVPAVGSTLWAVQGTWNGMPPPTYTFQWERDSGGGPVNIGGETGWSYTVVAGDVGKVISVMVTATNGGGQASQRSVPTATILAGVSKLYIGPVAVGARDGSSFDDAIALGTLAGAFGTLVPDAEVLIRADAGFYLFTSSINLTHGGTAGHPIIVRGCDVNEDPMKPLIIGSRNNWVLPADPEAATSVGGWSVGNEVFRLGAGANYITFQYLSFRNVGKCFNLNVAAVHDIIAEDWDFYNAQDGFYSYNYDCYNVTLRRMKATGYSKRAVRIYADCHDWLVEDFEFNSGRQDRDDFATGISFNDTAHDVVIRGYVADQNGNNIGMYSGVIENSHDSSGSYWNADGLSGENGNYNALVENLIIRGCTDGGIDTKASNWTIRNVVCYDNKKNFRIWGFPTIIENCVSRDPHKRGGSSSWVHFHLIAETDPYSGNVMDVTVRQCTIEDTGASNWVWSVYDTQIYNLLLRNISNTFINTVDGGLPNNCVKLTGAVGDNIDPVNTTPTPNSCYNKQGMLVTLSANEDVIWSKVSGDTGIKLLDNYMRELPTFGRYVKFPATTYIPGGDNNYAINLTAEDALGNVSSVPIQFNVINEIPPMVFYSTFEGTDLQQTPIYDLTTGKEIRFEHNAKLTATTPLEGVTSASLGGSYDQIYVDDPNDDFWFGADPFTIMALIKPSSYSFGGQGQFVILMHGTSVDNTRSWRLSLTATGQIDMNISTNGKDWVSARSIATVALNTVHEVAADRAEDGTVRTYLDGAMVASFAGPGTLKNPTAGLRIGRSSATNEGFVGRIDKVRIWKNYAFCASDAGYTP